MDVYYASQRLADACASEKQLKRKYGPVRAKRIAVRLRQLHVADSLADLLAVAPRTHQLTGNLTGCWAIDIDGPYRLLFEIAPDEELLDETDTTSTETLLATDPDDPERPNRLKPPDLATVTAVVVTDIIDYH